MSAIIMCMVKVSIPQAVGTVATTYHNNLNHEEYFLVSIPQAVGTVATPKGQKFNFYAVITFQYRKR